MATLLKIANEKYIQKVSHDTSNFSINGGIRNKSYIGQTSLARKTNKSYFTRYKGPIGKGGCCGIYNTSYIKKDRSCMNDPSIIKKSVLNTKGMLRQKNKWLYSTYPNSVVQPDSNFPLNDSSSSRTDKLKNNIISNGNTNNCVQSKETITLINNSAVARFNNLACNYTTSTFPYRVNNNNCTTIEK